MLGKQGGFSLIELMVVVAILGILATIALPKYRTMQAKARQTEAQSNLSHIATLEHTYFDNHAAYSTDLEELGFEVEGDSSRYVFSVTASGTGYTAIAEASSNDIIRSGCGKKDKWSIQETRVITNNVNCSSLK